MDNTLNSFLQFLSREKGFSSNTVAAYGNDLRQLAEFIRTEAGRNGQEPQWLAVERPLLLGYLANLREKRYSAATTARKVASMRSLFNYLSAQGQMERNPALDLASPRVEKSQPQVIGIEEIQSLLRATDAKPNPEAQRDGAMIELLFNSGLRVTELVSLDVSNVNQEPGYLRYHGLRGRSPARERRLSLPPQVLQRLQGYLSQSRPQLTSDSDEPALFLNRRGQRLTRQGLWLILKGYAKQAKLDGVTPHTLRHSIAAHLLHSGRMSLKELQEFLGHANSSTTQVYASVKPIPSSRLSKSKPR